MVRRSRILVTTLSGESPRWLCRRETGLCEMGRCQWAHRPEWPRLFTERLAGDAQGHPWKNKWSMSVLCPVSTTLGSQPCLRVKIPWNSPPYSRDFEAIGPEPGTDVIIIFLNCKRLCWDYCIATCSCKTWYREVPWTLYPVSPMVTACRTPAQCHQQDTDKDTGKTQNVLHHEEPSGRPSWLHLLPTSLLCAPAP